MQDGKLPVKKPVNGEVIVVAFNVLWKLMAALGILGLALASVLYGGQLVLDQDKLDKDVFVYYRDKHDKETEAYRNENRVAHEKIVETISEIQLDVREIKTMMKEEEK